MAIPVPTLFPRALINRILQHAQAQEACEVCGLIGAREGTPTTVYPVDNVAEQRESRFSLDPQQQIAAMRAMRERGEVLFAVFHSHPATPAEPSTLDMELGYPDVLQLIISLGTRGVLELRAFRALPTGGCVEVPLLLQPEREPGPNGRPGDADQRSRGA
ncbi:M67 family peptidase [Methylolobus aquaticus]|nr:M67 family peptidase [Methylolobus aquaticus]